MRGKMQNSVGISTHARHFYEFHLSVRAVSGVMVGCLEAVHVKEVGSVDGGQRASGNERKSEREREHRRTVDRTKDDVGYNGSTYFEVIVGSAHGNYKRRRKHTSAI